MLSLPKPVVKILRLTTTSRPAGVTGPILVRNVAYDKFVAVCAPRGPSYTYTGLPDEFLRSSAPASYSLTIGDLAARSPEWDRFSFTVKLEDYAQ